MKSMMKSKWQKAPWMLVIPLLTSCNPSPEFATFDPAQAKDDYFKKPGEEDFLPPDLTQSNPPGGGTTPIPTVTPTPIVTTTPGTGVVTYRDYQFNVSTTELRPMVDVLFVVDDSGSMSDEQQYLSNGVRGLVSKLKGYNINFHIQTTSNDGTKSITTKQTFYTPDPTTRPHSVLESFNLKPSINVTSTPLQIRDSMSDTEIQNVSNAFSQSILSLGINGSGREQGTCSMLRALQEEGTNKIFTNSSYAAFVLVSDEEDSTNLTYCHYQKTWDLNLDGSISNSTLVGFPGGTDPVNLHQTFVQKATAKFGSNGFIYSAIIHDQVENQKAGCNLTSGSYYGTKYRDLAGLINLSNVYSICAPDYSVALTNRIGNFVTELSVNTYRITLNSNETIEKVFLQRAGVESELIMGVDYNLRAENIEFDNNLLNSSDSIRVQIRQVN